MRIFEQGARVVLTETGKVGTVRRQFIDGYVSLKLDDGSPVQIDASGLEPHEHDTPKQERSR